MKIHREKNVFDVVDSTVTSSSNETSDNTVPSGSSSSESNSSLMEDSSQQDVQNETTDTSFEENDMAGNFYQNRQIFSLYC